MSDDVLDHGYCSFFARALFDYIPKERDMLKFRAGNVIEVLSQLENGWWDGLLDENTRGWFPSNYVELISDEQARIALRSMRSTSTPIEDVLSSTRLRPDSLAETACDAIRMLIEFTSYEYPSAPDVETSQSLVDQFLQTTKLVVHDVRQFVSSSEVWEVVRSSPQILQKDESTSLMRLHLLSKELTSLLSVLVLQMRELTKKIHWSIAHPYQRNTLWSEYLAEQKTMRESAVRLIEMITAFDYELNNAPPILKILLSKAQRDSPSSSLSNRSSSIINFSEDCPKSPPLRLELSPEVHALIANDIMPTPRGARQFLSRKGLKFDIRACHLTFQHLMHNLYSVIRVSFEPMVLIPPWLRPLRDILEHVGSMLILFDTIDLATPFGSFQQGSISKEFSEMSRTSENPNYQQYSNAKRRLTASTNDLFVAVQHILDTRKGGLTVTCNELYEKIHIMEGDAEHTLQMMGRCLSYMQGTFNSSTAENQACGATRETANTELRCNLPCEREKKPLESCPMANISMFPSPTSTNLVSHTRNFTKHKLDDSTLNDREKHELIMTDEGLIKGGTLAALVTALTNPEITDNGFLPAFLTTYKSFTTTDSFLALLIERYREEGPLDLNDAQKICWMNQKQRPVQIRVLMILSTWLDGYYDASDKPSLKTLFQFIQSDLSGDKSREQRQHLLRLIGHRNHGLEKPASVPESVNAIPVPILPSNLRSARLLDINPLELARQLTLMESKLFGKIKPSECLRKKWTSSPTLNNNCGISKTIILHNKVRDSTYPRSHAGLKRHY